MVGIRTDLTGAASDTFQAAVKQRQLDLPGGKIRSMEDLGGTERTEAEHKYLPKEADDEAKMVAPIPSTPVQVVDAPDSTGKQCPEQASSAAARLKERTAAAQKIYSKKAEQEVKKTFAKAYASMQAVDAQYVTEEQGLKLVIPVPEKRTTIKERTAVAQKIYSKKAEQEVKISICDNGMIDIDQEILGAGPDSKYITLPGHLEEYIYENFQRTPFKFIFSWRKRLFEEMHILPLPRMQFSGRAPSTRLQVVHPACTSVLTTSSLASTCCLGMHRMEVTRRRTSWRLLRHLVFLFSPLLCNSCIFYRGSSYNASSCLGCHPACP